MTAGNRIIRILLSVSLGAVLLLMSQWLKHVIADPLKMRLVLWMSVFLAGSMASSLIVSVKNKRLKNRHPGYNNFFIVTISVTLVLSFFLAALSLSFID